jgi:hypothetical protein
MNRAYSIAARAPHREATDADLTNLRADMGAMAA